MAGAEVEGGPIGGPETGTATSAGRTTSPAGIAATSAGPREGLGPGPGGEGGMAVAGVMVAAAATAAVVATGTR